MTETELKSYRRAFTARPRAARAGADANAEGLIKEQISLLHKLNRE